jgi:hypothetical protein
MIHTYMIDSQKMIVTNHMLRLTGTKMENGVLDYINKLSIKVSKRREIK